MKKSLILSGKRQSKKCWFRKSITAIFGAALLSVSLTSCDNFLAGSSLKELIDSAISYQNSESFKV